MPWVRKKYSIIKTYFQEKPIQKISLFGSIARREGDENSDVDILLEMKQPVGLMELSRYKNELEELVNIRVDIGTASGLSKYVATQVKERAEVIYKA